MKRLGLLLAMVVALVGGCARTDEPSPPPAAPPFAAPPADRQIAKPPAQAAKPQAGAAMQPQANRAERQANDAKLPAGQPGQSHDQFGLPLAIHVDAPEVPLEIKGPSPPIKEEPKPPSDGFNPWRWFQQTPKTP